MTTSTVLLDTNVFTAWLRPQSPLVSLYSKHVSATGSPSRSRPSRVRHGAITAGVAPGEQTSVRPHHLCRTQDLDWMAGLQHHRLAEYLRREMQYRWILSYDDDERLLTDVALYAAKAMTPSPSSRDLNDVKAWRMSKRVVTLNYTAASRTGRGPAKELLLTTFPPATVPINERLVAIT